MSPGVPIWGFRWRRGAATRWMARLPAVVKRIEVADAERLVEVATASRAGTFADFSTILVSAGTFFVSYNDLSARGRQEYQGHSEFRRPPPCVGKISGANL